jgi:hypothetical protein
MKVGETLLKILLNLNKMTEKELWKLIKSNDYRVWSIAKHRSAVALTELVENKRALAVEFIKLTEETGDQYYESLANELLYDA